MKGKIYLQITNAILNQLGSFFFILFEAEFNYFAIYNAYYFFLIGKFNSQLAPCSDTAEYLNYISST